MAKSSQSQSQSQSTTRGAGGAAKAGGAARKPLPQARRGSVTKPVGKSPKWVPFAISGGVIAVAAIFVVVILAARSPDDGIRTNVQRPAPVASPVAGAAAPNFTVKAKDGSTLTKENLLGKPTMMIFFASWCPHCNNEAPLLKDLAAKNPDVQFVAIGVGDRETTDDIYNFQSKHSLPFPTYADGGKAASAYGIASYPTVMAVDKNGIIKSIETGEKSQEQLSAVIAKAKG